MKWIVLIAVLAYLTVLGFLVATNDRGGPELPPRVDTLHTYDSTHSSRVDTLVVIDSLRIVDERHDKCANWVINRASWTCR